MHIRNVGDQFLFFYSLIPKERLLTMPLDVANDTVISRKKRNYKTQIQDFQEYFSS